MNDELDRRLWDGNGSRSLLEVAIERGEWELAALCMLTGFMEAARKLPPEGAEALLELLSIEGEPRRGHRRRRGRGRRHGPA